MLRELDFVNEALNTDLVKHNLRGVAGVKVPCVVRACAGTTPTPMTLVLEYIDGEKLTDPGAVARRRPELLVQSLSASFAQQIFVDGIFNADPHPGNLMVERSSGLLVLLDFGMTKHVDETQRIAFARLLLSAADADYAGLLLALKEMGLEASIDQPDEAMRAIRYMLRGSQGANDPRPLRRGGGSRMGTGPGGTGGAHSLASRAVNHSSSAAASRGGAPAYAARSSRYQVQATPGSVLFLLRVVACLRGMATTLGVGHSYLEAMRPYATRALRTALNPSGDGDGGLGGSGGSLQRQHQRAEVYAAPLGAGPLQEGVQALLAELCSSGATLGASVCVFHEGCLLVNAWAGELGSLDPRPVRADSLYSAFSCGKAVLSLLVHVLIHKGYLGLDERVAAIWPAFGEGGKGGVTVRHVLEHRAGLSEYVPEGATVRTLLDYDAMTKGLEGARSTEAGAMEGAAPSYHALSFGWIAGGMVQHAVARRNGGPLPSFGELLDEHIIRPLGLKGQLFAGLPPEGSEEAQRYNVYERLTACSIHRERRHDDKRADAGSNRGGGGGGRGGGAGDDDLFSELDDSSGGGDGVALDPRLFNDPSVRRANIPAANMHFTAHALATVYSCLAGGETAPRLLPPSYCETILKEARLAARSRWPLGFATYLSETGACGFGFNGLWNSCGICMPERRGGLAIAVLVNTYTPVAEAATRILDHVFQARGYGRLARHALGGVKFGADGDED